MKATQTPSLDLNTPKPRITSLSQCCSCGELPAALCRPAGRSCMPLKGSTSITKRVAAQKIARLSSRAPEISELAEMTSPPPAHPRCPPDSSINGLGLRPLNSGVSFATTALPVSFRRGFFSAGGCESGGSETKGAAVSLCGASSERSEVALLGTEFRYY